MLLFPFTYIFFFSSRSVLNHLLLIYISSLFLIHLHSLVSNPFLLFLLPFSSDHTSLLAYKSRSSLLLPLPLLHGVLSTRRRLYLLNVQFTRHTNVFSPSHAAIWTQFYDISSSILPSGLHVLHHSPRNIILSLAANMCRSAPSAPFFILFRRVNDMTLSKSQPTSMFRC